MRSTRGVTAFLRDRWFSIDLRSLGLFRIVFGLCLIGNLYDHAAGGNLRAFFSNEGVLPNHLALFAPIQERPWSLLFAFSRPGEVAVAFAAILVVYALYTVGWNTRVMQILVIVCFVSIVNRNLLLQDGGSFTCTILAVWTLFLPVGARFSIDRWLAVRDGWHAPSDRAVVATEDATNHPVHDSGAADGDASSESIFRRPARPAMHVSFVCFALLLQLAAIYGFNAANKTGDTWRRGTAVHYVLWQLSRNTSLAGFLRLHEPSWFSPVLTRATLIFEWSAPALVLIPVFQTVCRRILIGALWVFHLGIASLMSLGPFSYAMMTFSILLLRPADWRGLEYLARKGRLAVDRVVPRALLRPVLGTFAFIHRFGHRLGVHLPYRCRRPAQVPRSPTWRLSTILREGVALFLFVAMLAELTLANPVISERLQWKSRPAWLAETLYYLRVYQTWAMFSPDVPTEDGGVVVEAILADGSRIDPLTGRAPDFEAPLHGPYGLDHDWSEYMFYYPWDRHRVFRAGLRDYVVRRQQERDGAGSKRIRSLDIYRISADCPPPGEILPRNLKRELMISYAAER